MRKSVPPSATPRQSLPTPVHDEATCAFCQAAIFPPCAPHPPHLGRIDRLDRRASGPRPDAPHAALHLPPPRQLPSSASAPNRLTVRAPVPGACSSHIRRVHARPCPHGLPSRHLLAWSRDRRPGPGPGAQPLIRSAAARRGAYAPGSTRSRRATCPAGPRHRDSRPRAAIPAPTASSPRSSALSRRLEAMRAARCAPARRAPAPGAAVCRHHRTISPRFGRPPRQRPAGAPPPAPDARAERYAPRPPKTEFVGRQRNASALNPEISATGDVRLVAREGRQQDNGVAREFEVALQSALDPYSNTKIFLTFEDEEVGRRGGVHLLDRPARPPAGGRRQVPPAARRPQPLAPARAARDRVPARVPALPRRPKGSPASASRSTPRSRSRCSGGTHEVWVQGTTAESDPLYAGGHQPTLLFRLQNFWQLNRSTYAQLGFTGTGGNNDDADLRSRLAGSRLPADLPPARGGHPAGDHPPRRGLPAARRPSSAPPPTGTAPSWTSTRKLTPPLGPRRPLRLGRGAARRRGHRMAADPSITWWQSEFVYPPPRRRTPPQRPRRRAQPALAPGRLGDGPAQTRDLLTCITSLNDASRHC